MSEGDGIMMNALIQLARNASPYLAVELLLPGGSVIALLLWLFRHRLKKGTGGWIQGLASRFGLGAQVDKGSSSPQPMGSRAAA